MRRVLWKISKTWRQKEMRRTAFKQNGNASLFDNILFRFKSPEILYMYIFKTSEKAWLLTFNFHCTVATYFLTKNFHLIKMSLCNYQNSSKNFKCNNAVYKLWYVKIRFMEPLHMNWEIRIPSKSYSKEAAIKFSLKKEIWRDVDDDVDLRCTMKPSII